MVKNRAQLNSAADLRKLDRLSSVMDSAIKLPGGFRIGWDGIIGLIPGVGDIVSMGISLYIIRGAMRLGASKTTLLRMLGNVALESAVGIVPLFGDLFDFVFKANIRNMKILRKQFDDPASTDVQSSNWAGLWLVAVLVIFLLFAWLAFTILLRLLAWIF